MKVIEKGANRTAEAHIYVEGRVNALEEYGQYVDGHDKAICCYVPVEEGHKIRVDGRFSGTTLAVIYDVLVDGVCRKASSHVGKSVQVQKKRVIFDKFLYQVPDGIIDTDISVARHSGLVNLDKEARETVGTIELRVYVTRQFGVEHEVDDICKYDKIKEEADSSTSIATYKDVPPQFHMMFEKNCSILDGSKGTREKKKVYNRRPGTEPWAIFRFHYRTKDSIIDQEMDLTFNPTDKVYAKNEAHVLDLEPAPILLLGSRPADKNDGENSVRASSPPPRDTPSIPNKGPKKFQSTKPKVVVREPPSKFKSADPNRTSDVASFNHAQVVEVSKSSAAVVESTLQDLQPISATTEGDASANATANDTLNKQTVENSLATLEGDGSEEAAASTKTTTNISSNSLKPTESDVDTEGGSFRKNISKAADKTDTEWGDLTPSVLPGEVSYVPVVSHPAGVPSGFDPITASNPTTVLANALPNTGVFPKSSIKGYTSTLKMATAKPVSTNTTTLRLLPKPITPPAPATPVKRPPEGILTPPSDPKRAKTSFVPPLTPRRLTHSTSASLSPRSVSIEAQVAEQRKLLEAMRTKRAKLAKEKAIIDERMAPYKQRMAEELKRLRQETAEEESLLAEDEQEYDASEAMLAEFERADSEV